MSSWNVKSYSVKRFEDEKQMTGLISSLPLRFETYILSSLTKVKINKSITYNTADRYRDHHVIYTWEGGSPVKNKINRRPQKHRGHKQNKNGSKIQSEIHERDTEWRISDSDLPKEKENMSKKLC